jgi:hypothetical protein
VALIRRDEQGAYFVLRLTPRLWLIVGRWSADRIR